MQQIRSALFAAATVAVVGGIVGAPKQAAACNTEPYIGTICTFAFDWCPRGYLPADGRALTIQQNQALFALIGFAYGGDNQTNFKIPDLRGRVPIGKGQGAGLPVNVVMATNYGQQQQVLTAAQTPVQPHTHPATFVGTGGGGTQQVTVPAVASTLTATATTSLTASTSGQVKIANGNTGTVNPTSGSSLGKGGAQASIYTPATTSDFAIGGNQTFTGPVSGTVDVALGGSPGNPQIQFNVPLGITGGTVTVNPNTVVGATTPVNMMPPSIGMSVCIAVEGLYPNRP